MLCCNCFTEQPWCMPRKNSNARLFTGYCFCPPSTTQQQQIKTVKKKSRVPDQNGVSQAWYIVEIHHSGRKPSKYEIGFMWSCLSTLVSLWKKGQNEQGNHFFHFFSLDILLHASHMTVCFVVAQFLCGHLLHFCLIFMSVLVDLVHLISLVQCICACLLVL